jgi:hypothetical protein
MLFVLMSGPRSAVLQVMAVPKQTMEALQGGHICPYAMISDINGQIAIKFATENGKYISEYTLISVKCQYYRI